MHQIPTLPPRAPANMTKLVALSTHSQSQTALLAYACGMEGKSPIQDTERDVAHVLNTTHVEPVSSQSRGYKEKGYLTFKKLSREANKMQFMRGYINIFAYTTLSTIHATCTLFMASYIHDVHEHHAQINIGHA